VNPTTDHYIAQSLKEFLNWKCLSDLGAFKTVSGNFTTYKPEKKNFTAFGSPYAGFSYNSDISGVIPANLSGVSGLKIDYRNGRFLAPSGTSYSGGTTFSVNEVNFYVTSLPDSKLIFETKPLQNPVLSAATGFMPPNSVVAPCVFVKNYSSQSEEHCLGGYSKLDWTFKIVALMRREKELLGIQKIVRDARNEVFPILTETVFNEYGDLADPAWQYSEKMAAMDDYAFISDSTFKIVEADVFTDDNPKMFVGIGNLTVSFYENPREASRPEQGDGFFLELESEDYLEL